MPNRPTASLAMTLGGAIAFAALEAPLAAPVAVTVTVENLAPANSISFAPLHVGFHSGAFDAFNNGAPATAPIISVAEGGSASAWFPAFAAADPTATLGTVPGLLQPGEARSATFVVDPTVNRFVTFASMVVPSNDFFIGNDSPTAFQLLDASGNLLLTSILQEARDIWDAGSEAFDPANAAFVGDNDLRTAQNGVVSFNFSELGGFNGLLTAAGYAFNSGLSSDTDIARISFAVRPVPEPGTLAVLATAIIALGWGARRDRRGAEDPSVARA